MYRLPDGRVQMQLIEQVAFGSEDILQLAFSRVHALGAGFPCRFVRQKTNPVKLLVVSPDG